MKNTINLSNFNKIFSFLLKLDKPLIFLFFLGFSLCFAYALNYSIPVYDDLYWPDIFLNLVTKHGNLKAILIILTGSDLPHEYRTYGISRLIQFFLWQLGGEKSYLYPLVISFSQLGTAILLLSLMRSRGFDEDLSLGTATIWLVSPFWPTWCFHHYAYLILPFQFFILSAWIIERINITSNIKYFFVAILGVLCGLSGEMIILSGPIFLLFISLLSKSRSRLKLSLFLIASMAASTLIHWQIWLNFYQDPGHIQRYKFTLINNGVEILNRTFNTLNSIPRSFFIQLKEIVEAGFSWGIIIGIIVGFLFLASVNFNVNGRKHSIPKSLFSPEIKAGVFFLGISFLSLTIYLALSILTGQVSFIMPRRYGYIPLTLLLIALFFFATALLNIIFSKKVVSVSILIAIVSAFSGELYLVLIPHSRATDQLLSKKIQEARDSESIAQVSGKGALYFVSVNNQYQIPEANAATPGPKMTHLGIQTIAESPFIYYWTAQIYSNRLLGFDFSGMPKSKIENSQIEIGGSPEPLNPGSISQNSVVVVANLGFDESDPNGKNIRVFKNFQDFEPYFFGRKIERNPIGFSPDVAKEFIIDLGSTQLTAAANSSLMPDKLFSEQILAWDHKWISNYGFLDGANSIYAHPDISRSVDYYRTNRNGVFTYAVKFSGAKVVEVRMDFWEQWGRTVGEREFSLEISWDGISWANIGPIDPAKVNGDKPFSIVLTKKQPILFMFRMAPTNTSIDIPVIQGLRFRQI